MQCFAKQSQSNLMWTCLAILFKNFFFFRVCESRKCFQFYALIMFWLFSSTADLFWKREEKAMLRCRRCRKGLMDSTSLSAVSSYFCPSHLAICFLWEQSFLSAISCYMTVVCLAKSSAETMKKLPVTFWISGFSIIKIYFFSLFSMMWRG